MRLRVLSIASSAALVVLALSAVLGLVLITTRMEEQTGRLVAAQERRTRTERLQVALLTHARTLRQLELSSSDMYRMSVDRAEQLARRSLEAAREGLSAPEEAQLLEALSRSLEAYLQQSRNVLAIPAPGQAAPLLAEEQLEEALALTRKLLELRTLLVLKEMERVQSWNHAADVLGGALGVLLLAGTAGVLWLFRQQLYVPLRRLHTALIRYGRDGQTGRMPEAGAHELRDVAVELNALTARLERQHEQQLAFIAGVAHDLRTPLGTLRTQTALLRRSPPGPDALQERTARMERQLDRLDRQLTDLLDTARIEAGELELTFARHDVCELVRDVAELHRELSEQHAIELQLPDAPVQVRCDATRISQTLNNLLSNAIKYSPGGGTVRVSLHASAQAVRVAVADQGVGIAADELPLLFEPFRRAPSTRDAIPGVGLGLSVAQRIARAHGGHIQVESTPGVGSVFTLCLSREGPAGPP